MVHLVLKVVAIPKDPNYSEARYVGCPYYVIMVLGRYPLLGCLDPWGIGYARIEECGRGRGYRMKMDLLRQLSMQVGLKGSRHLIVEVLGPRTTCIMHGFVD